MSAIRRFAARVRGLFAGARGDRELAAELEAHVAFATEDLIRKGMEPNEARRAALIASGGLENAKEAYRDSRGFPAIDGVMQDARLALRSLRRAPVFTAAILLTLTVGVGATTAIYHIIDRVVLHPVPYPDPDRIVYLGWHWAKGSGAGALSPREFVFWHDQARVFDGLTTFRPFGGSLTTSASQAQGESIDALRVSPDFFKVIGLAPTLGRGFATAEFAPPGENVLVISHALWMTRFGGDSTVIGRTVRLSREPYLIVGIMPEAFDYAGHGEHADALAPLVFTQAMLADNGNNYPGVGRLRRGESAAAVHQDMDRVFALYRQAYPEVVEEGARGVTLKSYQEYFVGDFRTQLWILFGATSFVLLLACANAGNLLYARVLAQRQQFAIALALGAGRRRIMRRMLVESLVLGIVAAFLATVVSLASLRLLAQLTTGDFVLANHQLGIDTRVVVFTTLIALTSALFVSMTVALAATNIDLAAALAESSRGGSTGRTQRVARNALVAVESGLAVVLLLAAVLFISSFARLIGVDPGYARQGVVTAAIGQPAPGYDSIAAILPFEDRVLERLRATPGVLSAAAASTVPLQRGWNIPITIDDQPQVGEGAAEWRAVSPGFFVTYGVRLLRGRDITRSDGRGAPPVVIVSQSLAKAYWPGQDPIGHRIRIGRWRDQLIDPRFDDVTREVIGIAPDLRDMSLDLRVPRHTMWIPQAQVLDGMAAVPVFVVRAHHEQIAAQALRQAIREIDAQMAGLTIKPMSALVADSVSSRRFNMILMMVFAAVALALTMIGIYGVVAYAVARRSTELGIRMALGASPRAVVGMVLREWMRPVVIGLVFGLAAAFVLARLLTEMLYGVSPHDPSMFVITTTGILIVALIANYLPARRAARASPLAALRAE